MLCATFRKFLTWGCAKAKKCQNFQCLALSIQEKVFNETNGTDGKHILQRCAFWQSQLARYQELQMGNTKPEKNLGFWKFILFILSNAEKFAEFNGEIIFQIRAKIEAISPENSMYEQLLDNRKRLSSENCFCSMAVLY